MEQLVYGGEHAEREDIAPLVFQPRDRFHLLVEDHPEFSEELVLSEDGMVRVPQTVMLVHAQGRTVDEVRREIADAIAPLVRGVPDVKITLDRVLGGYYHIYGGVARPGRYPLGVAPVRVSEAVFRAVSEAVGEGPVDNLLQIRPRGGFAVPSDARLDRVILLTPHRTQPVRETIDVRAALLGGRMARDPFVQPGQIILVPDASGTLPEVVLKTDQEPVVVEKP